MLLCMIVLPAAEDCLTQSRHRWQLQRPLCYAGLPIITWHQELQFRWEHFSTQTGDTASGRSERRQRGQTLVYLRRPCMAPKECQHSNETLPRLRQKG